MIAFSDGVSEAMNEEGDEFSDERLIASVQAHMGGSPQALLDGLLADVRQFCGAATPNDDVTMVVVRYEGNVTESALPSVCGICSSSPSC